MNKKLRLNIKVEPPSNFTFTGDSSYIAFIYLQRKIYARTHVKLVQQLKATFNLLVIHACGNIDNFLIIDRDND